MRYTKSDVEFARKALLELCPAGTTVYTILRSVSRSGMRRTIDLYVIKDGEPRWITYHVAVLLGMPRKGDALIVNGCGMDMGFHVVNNLSITLHCPAGQYTHDGAYALKHEWL